MAASAAPTAAWNASISKASWRALVASWLGWMFDGYETWALVLVMMPAVHRLLSPERLPKASIYAGGLLTATLMGWASGGIVAGVLADYVGRRRMLMLSILCYAVFAGLTALSWNYWSLLAFRFCTGIGLGAEWGPGAAIVVTIYLPELFPTRLRGSAISLVCKSSRIVAGLGPLVTGWLVSFFGGIGTAAAMISLIYVVGLVVTPFAGPETKGKPLPA